MTHDLFVSFAHAFGIKLREVFIYRFEDGIFSSELTFSDDERTIVIDSRTSDAIAIAMRTGAPIFTTPEILEETGFLLEESSQEDEDEAAAADAPVFVEEEDDVADGEPAPKIENYTVEELQKLLARLIEQENYEEAARVNEIIKRKQK